MKCTYVELEGGVYAIVCGGRRYGEGAKKCKTCGAPATKLCDWILARDRKPLAGAIAVKSLDTCDEPICDTCARSPKRGKDLCPTHDAAWATDPRNKTPGLPLGGSITSAAPASASTSTSSRR